MLRTILTLIIPGILFSANTHFERAGQASKKANPNHVKKRYPKKTKKQPAQIDKVNKEKKQVSAHISKSTKSASANLKKAVTERRMKAAKARRK